jgi:hypothetical protein
VTSGHSARQSLPPAASRGRRLKRAARAMLALAALAASAIVHAAGPTSVGYRVMTGYRDSGSYFVQAGFLRWQREPRGLLWETALGTFYRRDQHRVFVSGGPTWRFGPWSRFHLDLGIHPTFLGGSRFHGADLGGNFHFTSFVSAGLILGRRHELAARIQHTSNAGLNDDNPGADVAGIDYSYRFGAER